MLAALLGGPASAQDASAGGNRLDIGLVLDAAYASRALALSGRERGFGLGHNELTAAGAIDPLFIGRATAVLHAHDGDTEVELEEAWLQTTSLPGGLQLRAGRFLAALGQLNEQHVHADDFVERPLLHRAFLGGHYYDDGLRLNWVAPLPWYWRVGVEALSGRQLVRDSTTDPALGAWTLSTQIGADLGRSHSWQVGAAVLGNRREASGDADHDHEHEGEAGHDHDHAHGALYSGRRMWLLDATWKWAPDGNNRTRQLRLSGAVARVTDIARFGDSGDLHEAAYVAAVWRWHPQWETGLRVDRLQLREPHGDHFDTRHLDEASLALTWKPSHFSALRLQFTRQRNVRGFADEAGHAVLLQYTASLGAHGAHGF